MKIALKTWPKFNAAVKMASMNFGDNQAIKIDNPKRSLILYDNREENYILCLLPDSNYLSRISDEYRYTTSDKGNIATLEVKADLTDIEEDSRIYFYDFKDGFSDITRQPNTSDQHQFS